MARDIKGALDAASSAVDKANASVAHSLEELADSNRRAAIIAEVQHEVSQNPGWLGEIGEFIKADYSATRQRTN